MSIRFIFLCLSITLFTACTSFRPNKERTPAASYYVDLDYNTHRDLILNAISLRAEALRFIEETKMEQSDSVSFTREEGEYIRDLGAKYLGIREKLLGLMASEDKLFTYLKGVEFSPTEGTKEKYKSKVRSGVTRKTYIIDPLDAAGEKMIFRIHMALASSLILMDNYLIFIEPFQHNDAMKYVLNYDVPQREALATITKSYSSLQNRAQIAAAIEFIDTYMSWRRKQGLDSSPELDLLSSYIQSSIWYLAVKNDKVENAFEAKAASIWERLTRKTKRGARVASYGLSMGFGNLVGLVATREGYLYNMSDKEQRGLIEEMKPLDILMEKTPFRLTDKFIPGHYGHVAIWIGTEAQLKDLGVWEKIPKHFQAKIRSGHHIVEALRPGVELNSLGHFLNIDDFLVVRDNRPEVTVEYRAKAILKAIEQIGKEYDFNFDVHTHERIVCSEIAYVVFPDIKWPLEEAVRRYTISPDNVAQLAIGENRIFEPVIMYYGGKRVYKNLEDSLPLLLKASDESYAQFERMHNL